MNHMRLLEEVTTSFGSNDLCCNWCIISPFRAVIPEATLGGKWPTRNTFSSSLMCESNNPPGTENGTSSAVATHSNTNSPIAGWR